MSNLQYTTSEKDGVLMITCPHTIDGVDAAAIDGLVKSWLLSPSKVHVLNFEAVTAFKPVAYRTFVLYNQALKASGKCLFFVNLNPELFKQFKQDGLTSVFVTVSSLDEALEKAAPKAGSGIDLEFINPFIAAARSVLETQAQLPLNPGKPVFKKPEDKFPMEIAGVIALTCREFTGSINLCFRGETFLKIYEGLTGEKHPTITTEIEDAAAEILNIIFGQAKTVLNDQKGYSLDRALPTVLTGDRLRLYHTSKSPAIVIPFDSPAGPFHLEIVIEKS